MDYTLDGWLIALLLWLVRLSIALLLFFVGRRYARKAREGVINLLRNPRIQVSMGPSVPGIAGEIVFVALWVIVISVALVLLGVPATFVIGSIIILVALLAYALRESLSNLAATVMFTFFKPFYKGETIETNGFTGTVYDMELFNTVLLTPEQRLITLPNSQIQTEGMINYSRMPFARISVDFLVAYDQDIDTIRNAVLEVMAADEHVAADPVATVVVNDLRVQGIRMTASATVPTAVRADVTTDLRAAILKRLKTMGVHFPELPLPQPEA